MCKRIVLTENRRQELARLLFLQLTKGETWVNKHPSGDTSFDKVGDYLFYEWWVKQAHFPVDLLEVLESFCEDYIEAISFGESLMVSVLEPKKTTSKILELQKAA